MTAHLQGTTRKDRKNHTITLYIMKLNEILDPDFNQKWSEFIKWICSLKF